jgi:AMP deaminase
VLQIPRIYQLIKPTGKFESFHDLLERIFRPLFEVTIKPESDPDLHELLKQVSGFDTIGAEDEDGRQLVPGDEKICEAELSATCWTAANPPFNIYAYYIYANLFVLNMLRAQRGLNQFAFRPTCGEVQPSVGSKGNLSAAFLLAQSISQGLHLKTHSSSVLQYRYYVAQIGISMSPLSNGAIVTNLDTHPFPSLYKRGLNVSLSTDGPFVVHNVEEEPLQEEYFSAAQTWGLSSRWR